LIQDFDFVRFERASCGSLCTKWRKMKQKVWRKSTKCSIPRLCIGSKNQSRYWRILRKYETSARICGKLLFST
jgi:hypothetical protein